MDLTKQIFCIIIQDDNSIKYLLYPSSESANNHLLDFIGLVIKRMTVKQSSIHLLISTNIGFPDTSYPSNKTDAIIETIRSILNVLDHIELVNNQAIHLRA